MTSGLLAWAHLCLRCEEWSLVHTVQSLSDWERQTPEGPTLSEAPAVFGRAAPGGEEQRAGLCSQ